ncbi:MAG TPA: tRNA pseudouridine(55) synthase TruB [Nitrospira sp.]
MTVAAQRSSTMDGVLAIRKEAGWTSHDVVSKIRQILGGAKIGHAGTLDPSATGVLPVLIDRGTRIAEYLVEWNKEYHAVLRLGETTDTLDATGTVLSRQPTDDVTEAAIHEVVGRFRGVIRQVPPMYSAVKVGGVPLYKLARAGKTVPRDARTVVISALDVLAIRGRDVTLKLICSKGTYVRTLCADLGEALGVGAHLVTLERRRVGPLALEQAITVEEVAMREALGQLSSHVMSLDVALQNLPVVTVDGSMVDHVRHGAPVSLQGLTLGGGLSVLIRKPDTRVRIHDPHDRLVAIGRYPGERGTSLLVDKVLIPHE